ncbi:MAG: GNAT family N-acetyltransferase [Amylibacter sp.]
MKLVAGHPQGFSPEIPELIWSEDPELLQLEFQSFEKWHAICAVEWPTTGAGNCHDATTLELQNGKVCGFINAFSWDEVEPCFAKTDALRGPSHLSDDTIAQMDSLFTSPAQNAFFVLDISVAPSTQNIGLGAKLIAHAETLARAKNHTSLCLDARETNAALGFYQHLGFTISTRSHAPELDAHNIKAYLHITREITH